MCKERASLLSLLLCPLKTSLILLHQDPMPLIILHLDRHALSYIVNTSPMSHIPPVSPSPLHLFVLKLPLPFLCVLGPYSLYVPSYIKFFSSHIMMSLKDLDTLNSVEKVAYVHGWTGIIRM